MSNLSSIPPCPGIILEKSFFNYGDDDDAKIATKALCQYYEKVGYGIMADFVAFNWDGDRERLTGINHYSDMTFEKIYGYERQKQELIKNTEAFINNKPANNILAVVGASTCALGNHKCKK